MEAIALDKETGSKSTFPSGMQGVAHADRDLAHYIFQRIWNGFRMGVGYASYYTKWASSNLTSAIKHDDQAKGCTCAGTQ